MRLFATAIENYGASKKDTKDKWRNFPGEVVHFKFF
jgi:hypothetical protein